MIGRLQRAGQPVLRLGPAGAGNKLALLGGIYIARSLILAWYFMLPPSPASTLLFGALMGFLWMGVGRWSPAPSPRCSGCNGRP